MESLTLKGIIYFFDLVQSVSILCKNTYSSDLSVVTMLWIDSIPYPYESVKEDPESLGLYLVIRHDQEGFIQHADLGLINFSDLTYSYLLEFPDLDQANCSDLIKPHQAHLLKGMPSDWYQGKRAFNIMAAEVSTEGTGKMLRTQVKIRNKQLISSGRFDALINAKLVLLAEYPWASAHESKELKAIAKEQAELIKERPRKTFYSSNDPLQKANFPSVLDLHVQQLKEDTKGMTSAEILMLQLDKFDRFIDEALRLDIDTVFVIHGVGKGRLKSEIFRRLSNHPHVKDYKNEFHPRYKFGATEIEFR